MGYFPNGYGEMVIRYGISGDSEDKTVALGFASALGNDEPSLTAAALELAGYWTDEMHSTGAAGMTVPWEKRGFRWSFRVAGVEYSGELEEPLVGTASGDSPVVHTSFLVKKLTGFAGPKNKGRMFLPMFFGVDSDIATDGTIDPDLRDTAQNRLTAFAAACLAGDVDLKLLHGLIEDGLNPSPPPKYLYDIPTDPIRTITSFVVQSKVATQRRRLTR